MARVILDGYNLLLTAGRGALELDREALVGEAARYRGSRQVEVTIVFDSRAGYGSSVATAWPGIRVEFARGDADTHILDILRRSRTPRDMLVVTSDRRLAEQARDLGARTEDSAAFRKRCASRQAEGSKTGTGRRLSPEEVEAWERRFRERRRDDEF